MRHPQARAPGGAGEQGRGNRRADIPVMVEDLQCEASLEHPVFAGGGRMGMAGQPPSGSLRAAFPEPRQKAPVEIECAPLFEDIGRLVGSDMVQAQPLQLAAEWRTEGAFFSAQ